MATSGKKFVAVTVTAFVITQLLAWVTSPPNNSAFTLSKIAAISILIQWLVFVHASGVLGNERTEKFYDLTGSLTFTSLSLFSIYSLGGISKLTSRQFLATSSVLIWCIRLGSFLFSRIQKEGQDSRFIVIKKDFLRFWSTWTIQGVWVFITALPVFVLNAGGDQGPSALTPVDFLGAGLWLFGFLFEVTADWQKTVWKSDHRNKGKFIASGLWSISRHPNYFGEMTLWLGSFILCSSGFSHWSQFISGISPIFVFLLLVYLSGIPMLEKAGEERWKDDAAYKSHVNSVPVLIPFFGRKGNAAF